MSLIEIKCPNIYEVKLRLGQVNKQAPAVIARVINRVAQNVKTNMSKEVTKNYVVKSGEVKKTIKIKKANKNQLGALVKSDGMKIPLYDFKLNNNQPNQAMPSKSRKPYKVKIKKSGGLKTVLDGFVAKMKSGHLGVFKKDSSKSLPIKELFSASIPQMIGNKEVYSRIEKEANSTLQKRLNHEIDRMLSKK